MSARCAFLLNAKNKNDRNTPIRLLRLNQERAAEERGIPRVALSGGVAYNRAIRETVAGEVQAAGLEVVMNREYPLGDGCISFGQVVYGGSGE